MVLPALTWPIPIRTRVSLHEKVSAEVRFVPRLLPHTCRPHPSQECEQERRGGGGAAGGAGSARPEDLGVASKLEHSKAEEVVTPQHLSDKKFHVLESL